MIVEKFAVINAATSGDANTIVAAVAGKQIRVLSYTLIADAAVTATWKSGTTAISGAMSLPANGGAAPTCQSGVLQTATGEALMMTLGGAVGVRGHLTYVEITP